MRKLLTLIAFILAPFYLLAQSNIIDLSEHGLVATIDNPNAYEYTIDTDDDPMCLAVYKIRLNGERISVNVLDKKKMTNKKLIGMMDQALKTASNKSVKIKVISRTPTMLMIERTTVSSGDKIYKFLYTTTQKGKDIMIESSDMSDKDLCNEFLAMAKSFKLK